MPSTTQRPESPVFDLLDDDTSPPINIQSGRGRSAPRKRGSEGAESVPLLNVTGASSTIDVPASTSNPLSSTSSPFHQLITAASNDAEAKQEQADSEQKHLDELAAAKKMIEGVGHAVLDVPGERSLFLFRLHNPLRRFTLYIVRAKHFETFIVIIILLNCVALALDDNSPIDTPRGQAFQRAENVFTACFTAEFVLKVIAYGFYFNGPLSYLRSSWNVLDFLVVALSWLQYIDGMQNYSGLRTFRVLRPLRTIKNVAGMRVIIVSILSALPGLLDVLLLLTFVLFMFGIVGMQLYGGDFQQRCFYIETGIQVEVDDGAGLCSMNAKVGRQCDANQFCAPVGSNPNNGVTNFDNILFSWLTILQCISLEGWSDIMYMVEDTNSMWNQLYFIAMIVIGSLFVINLVTAVVYIRYEKTKEMEEKKQHEQKRLRKEARKLLRAEERRQLEEWKRMNRKQEKEKEKLSRNGSKSLLSKKGSLSRFGSLSRHFKSGSGSGSGDGSGSGKKEKRKKSQNHGKKHKHKHKHHHDNSNEPPNVTKARPSLQLGTGDKANQFAELSSSAASKSASSIPTSPQNRRPSMNRVRSSNTEKTPRLTADSIARHSVAISDAYATGGDATSDQLSDIRSIDSAVDSRRFFRTDTMNSDTDLSQSQTLLTALNNGGLMRFEDSGAPPPPPPAPPQPTPPSAALQASKHIINRFGAADADYIDSISASSLTSTTSVTSNKQRKQQLQQQPAPYSRMSQRLWYREHRHLIKSGDQPLTLNTFSSLDNHDLDATIAGVDDKVTDIVSLQQQPQMQCAQPVYRKFIFHANPLDNVHGEQADDDRDDNNDSDTQVQRHAKTATVASGGASVSKVDQYIVAVNDGANTSAYANSVDDILSSASVSASSSASASASKISADKLKLSAQQCIVKIAGMNEGEHDAGATGLAAIYRRYEIDAARAVETKTAAIAAVDNAAIATNSSVEATKVINVASNAGIERNIPATDESVDATKAPSTDDTADVEVAVDNNDDEHAAAAAVAAAVAVEMIAPIMPMPAADTAPVAIEAPTVFVETADAAETSDARIMDLSDGDDDSDDDAGGGHVLRRLRTPSRIQPFSGPATVQTMPPLNNSTGTIDDDVDNDNDGQNVDPPPPPPKPSVFTFSGSPDSDSSDVDNDEQNFVTTKQKEANDIATKAKKDAKQKKTEADEKPNGEGPSLLLPLDHLLTVTGNDDADTIDHLYALPRSSSSAVDTAMSSSASPRNRAVIDADSRMHQRIASELSSRRTSIDNDTESNIITTGGTGVFGKMVYTPESTFVVGADAAAAAVAKVKASQEAIVAATGVEDDPSLDIEDEEHRERLIYASVPADDDGEDVEQSVDRLLRNKRRAFINAPVRLTKEIIFHARRSSHADAAADAADAVNRVAAARLDEAAANDNGDDDDADVRRRGDEYVDATADVYHDVLSDDDNDDAVVIPNDNKSKRHLRQHILKHRHETSDADFVDKLEKNYDTIGAYASAVDDILTTPLHAHTHRAGGSDDDEMAANTSNIDVDDDTGDDADKVTTTFDTAMTAEQQFLSHITLGLDGGSASASGSATPGGNINDAKSPRSRNRSLLSTAKKTPDSAGITRRSSFRGGTNASSGHSPGSKSSGGHSPGGAAPMSRRPLLVSEQHCSIKRPEVASSDDDDDSDKNDDEKRPSDDDDAGTVNDVQDELDKNNKSDDDGDNGAAGGDAATGDGDGGSGPDGNDSGATEDGHDGGGNGGSSNGDGQGRGGAHNDDAGVNDNATTTDMHDADTNKNAATSVAADVDSNNGTAANANVVAAAAAVNTVSEPKNASTLSLTVDVEDMSTATSTPSSTLSPSKVSPASQLSATRIRAAMIAAGALPRHRLLIAASTPPPTTESSLSSVPGAVTARAALVGTAAAPDPVASPFSPAVRQPFAFNLPSLAGPATTATKAATLSSSTSQGKPRRAVDVALERELAAYVGYSLHDANPVGADAAAAAAGEIGDDESAAMDAARKTAADNVDALMGLGHNDSKVVTGDGDGDDAAAGATKEFEMTFHPDELSEMAEKARMTAEKRAVMMKMRLEHQRLHGGEEDELPPTMDESQLSITGITGVSSTDLASCFDEAQQNIITEKLREHQQRQQLLQEDSDPGAPGSSDSQTGGSWSGEYTSSTYSGSSSYSDESWDSDDSLFYSDSDDDSSDDEDDEFSIRPTHSRTLRPAGGGNRFSVFGSRVTAAIGKSNAANNDGTSSRVSRSTSRARGASRSRGTGGAVGRLSADEASKFQAWQMQKFADKFKQKAAIAAAGGPDVARSNSSIHHVATLLDDSGRSAAERQAMAKVVNDVTAARQLQMEQDAGLVDNIWSRTKTTPENRPFFDKYVAVPLNGIVTHPRFQNIIVFFIVINTILLSLDHASISDRNESLLQSANLFFTYLFTAELVIKVIGLGIKAYVADSFNVFDAIVVALSWMDVFLNRSGGAFSALRTFRLLRMFKLLRSFRTLRALFQAVLNSMQDLFYFSLIFMLFMFIFAILGLQMFREKFNFVPEGQSRAHFDDFGWACVTVFQIITGEDWNAVMYDGVRGNGYHSIFYFVALFTVGNYIVLSIFLAILLPSDDEYRKDDDDDDDAVTINGKKYPKQVGQVGRHGSGVITRVGKALEKVAESDKRTAEATEAAAAAGDDDIESQHQNITRSDSRRRSRRRSREQRRASREQGRRSRSGRGAGMDGSIIGICAETGSSVRVSRGVSRTNTFGKNQAADGDTSKETTAGANSKHKHMGSANSTHASMSGSTIRTVGGFTASDQIAVAAEAISNTTAQDTANTEDTFADKDEELQDLDEVNRSNNCCPSILKCCHRAIVKPFVAPEDAEEHTIVIRERKQSVMVMDDAHAFIPPVDDNHRETAGSGLLSRMLSFSRRGSRVQSTSLSHRCSNASTTAAAPATTTADGSDSDSLAGSSSGRSSSASVTGGSDRGDSGSLVLRPSSAGDSTSSTAKPLQLRPSSAGPVPCASSTTSVTSMSNAATDLKMQKFNQGNTPAKRPKSRFSFGSRMHQKSDLIDGHRHANAKGNKSVYYKTKTARHAPTHKQNENQSKIVKLKGMACFCLPPTHKWRQRLVKLVHHSWFEALVFLVIFFSSIALAMDEPGISDERARMLYQFDIIVTTFFAVEMMLKCAALGVVGHPGAYLRDYWNQLDAGIVFVSVLNLLIGHLDFFKSMRALRALRPLRFISRFQNMRLVVAAIFGTIPSLLNVLVVAFLFFLIFAIIGVQFFKGRFAACYSDSTTRLVEFDEVTCEALGHRWQNPSGTHFDHTAAALLLLFQVASLEQWPSIMQLALDATPPGQAPEVDYSRLPAIYFVCFIMVGSFFVVSLFVGAVVDEYNKKHAKFTGSHSLSDPQIWYLEAFKDLLYNGPPVAPMPPRVEVITWANIRTCFTCKCRWNKEMSTATDRKNELRNEVKTQEQKKQELSQKGTRFSRSNRSRRVKSLKKQSATEWMSTDQTNQLSDLKTATSGKFTKRRAAAVSSDRTVDGVDASSPLPSIASVLKNDQDGDTDDEAANADFNQMPAFRRQMSLNTSSLSSAALASLSLADALQPQPQSPLANSGHDRSQSQNFDAPFLSRDDSMSHSVTDQSSDHPLGDGDQVPSMMRATTAPMPPPTRTSPLTVAQLDTASATADTAATRSQSPPPPPPLPPTQELSAKADELSGDKAAAEESKSVVLAEAVAAPISLSSSQSATSVLVDDTTERPPLDHGPQQTAVNMTTGNMQVNIDAIFAPTHGHQFFVQKLETSCELRWRTRVFRLVHHDFFEGFILLCICINVIALAMYYYDMDDNYEFYLDRLNDVFTWVFVGEFLLKLIALGFSQYFKDGWNLFDFIIVCISLVTFSLARTLAPGEDKVFGVDPTVFRVFRVLRLFRVVKRAKGLLQLIQTLIFSLPALYNVTSLLMLLFFVYAVAGMNLFGQIKDGAFISEHANFRDFRTAMITLFRMSTGESWNGLMSDCMVEPPNCVDPHCGSAALAVTYFLTFTVLSTFLMLNVFVAVVLKNFEMEVNKDPATCTSPVSRAEIIKFGQWWARATPQFQYLMPVYDIPKFLLVLPPPFGYAGTGIRRSELLRVVNKLELPQFREYCHFVDVLENLTYHLLQQLPGPSIDDIPADNEMLKGIKTQVYVVYPKLKKSRDFRFSVADALGARIVQRAWRMHKKRTKSFNTSTGVTTRLSGQSLPTMDETVTDTDSLSQTGRADDEQ